MVSGNKQKSDGETAGPAKEVKLPSDHAGKVIQSKQVAADNANMGLEKKRKGDDETSGPVKKPKLQSNHAENSLHHYGQACFINATMHLLHSVPAFADMENEDNDVTEADNNLNKEEMNRASGTGQTRERQDVRAKLRNHLEPKAERGEP